MSNNPNDGQVADRPFVRSKSRTLLALAAACVAVAVLGAPSASAALYETVDLGVLPRVWRDLPHISSYGHGINESGWTVGHSQAFGGNDRHAFRHTGYGIQEVPTDYDSVAEAINSAGKVVGWLSPGAWL